MMRKHSKVWMTLLVAVLLAVAVPMGTTTAFGDEAETPVVPKVAENVPFFDNPPPPDESTITKQADGSYTVDMPSGGGGTRVFYGDYTHGLDEHPYLLDLTDATLRISVDRLANNQQILFGFMAYEPSGNVYPMGEHGRGLSFRLVDDGNHGFMPSIVKYTRDSGYEEAITGNQYFVYNNASPRTSYLGKEFTLHIYVQDEALHMDADWKRDEVNTSTAYDFRAQIPLSDLPSTSVTVNGTEYAGFDYTQAYFMITNNDGANGAAVTIYDISDATTDAYYTAMGGQTAHTLDVTTAFLAKVEAFPSESATREQIETFYAAQTEFAALAANMRKCDAYEHARALAAAAEKVDSVAAKAAIECVTAIGTVANTTECKGKIDAARSLYDLLPASAQALVTNYADLQQAETDYAALVAAAEAAQAAATNAP